MRLARSKDGVTVDSTTTTDEDDETVVSYVHKIKMFLLKNSMQEIIASSNSRITLN